MRAFAMLIFSALVSTTALGQVYKCKDASGHLTYSNMGCQGNHSGQAIMRERTFEEKVAEREQAYEAEMRKRERRRAKAEQQAREDAAFAEEHARQAAAASAGSSYSQRLAARNAGVNSNLSGGASGSRGMTRSQRELALSQARSPQERAAAMREATTVMPGAQGLTASQRDAAARIASTPAGQPIPRSTLSQDLLPSTPTANHPPPTSAHTHITSCTGGFCQDSAGTPYSRSGDGRFMHNTKTGQTCSVSADGRTMVCH